jgi:hypothetical protein
MSIFNTLANFGRANAESKAAQTQTRNAREARDDAMALLRNQNREPDLVSKHIGPYQRSESPIADAFLESMLTGQNPAAISSTRAGGAGQRMAAQRGFDASTGGFDALRARQQAMQGETPWRVKPFKSLADTRTPARLQFDRDEDFVRNVMSSDANRDFYRTTRR